MNQEEITEIEKLSIDLNINLLILKNAVSNLDNDLEILDLVAFVETIHKTSNEMREIFGNSIG